ncbi:hypothetical protein GCM10025865_13970 [Paraoerskovia sediminicola]|uniref:Protein kinase domain-containing protein n=1 Tax=Paraoerskovia sediminicola TaxID=1138587 RepID=A0ABN6XF30_9CELL|nr:AarF/UbiB family protein [Paraoerskovia sediminicola]BDZ42098.1 hypothetical protein GCM10025865_13970 [Paraoerskovia sediminicola]
MLPEEKTALAGALFDSVLKQIAFHGVFHADLHPGNILISGTDNEPHLALLDFGSVGRLGRADREAVGLLLIAFDADDSVAATDALTMMLGTPEGFVRRDFERHLGELMLRGSTSTDLFTDLARLLSTSGFRIPPMIAAAFRAMAVLEGSMRLIAPEFDVIEAVRSRTGSSIRDAIENTDVRAAVESQVAAALPLIRFRNGSTESSRISRRVVSPCRSVHWRVSSTGPCSVRWCAKPRPRSSARFSPSAVSR